MKRNALPKQSRGARKALLLATLIFALTTGFAHAQPYPAKPIRLVVTSPPGGSQDFLARLLGQTLSPALGQQVIVENRTGASGVIGIDFVAKAAPDGYTLLLGAAGPIAIVPAFNARLLAIRINTQRRDARS